jgi:hypothetical protein
MLVIIIKLMIICEFILSLSKYILNHFSMPDALLNLGIWTNETDKNLPSVDLYLSYEGKDKLKNKI